MPIKKHKSVCDSYLSLVSCCYTVPSFLLCVSSPEQIKEMKSSTLAAVLVAAFTPLASAHAGHDHSHGEERVWSAADLEELENKWGTDFGFSGINTFGALNRIHIFECLSRESSD